MRDLDFVSGRFFDYDVPKEKRYLLKYFKSDLQRAFLKYFMVFGDHRNFTDHTGHYCNPRFVLHMEEKFHKLVDVYDKAKRALTEEGMATVHLIESGKFRLTWKTKS